MTQKTIENEVTQLINSNFPELKEVAIEVKIEKIRDAYMSVTKKSFENVFILSVDPVIISFSLFGFRGYLAYMLCYTVFINRGVVNLLNFILSHDNDADAQRRMLDMDVINRGLGEYLLKFHKDHDKQYVKYNASEGLTRQEIKKILNLRKKTKKL